MPRPAGRTPAVFVHGDGTPVDKLPHVAGKIIPAGYELGEQPQRNLVLGGALGLGLTYGLTLAVGAALVAGDNDGGAALFAPVLGPFIAIGTLGVTERGAVQDAARAMLVVDGLAQSASLTVLVLGFALPEDVLVRSELALSLTPTVPGTRAPGLGLVGEL
ncbi:MAG: hypothetical protein HY908_10960 [Myxococcales bacterium]|nr:hypothetical protein [Myxococcales bacterium]